MVNIDTIHLEIPVEANAIRDIDHSKYDPRIKVDRGIVEEIGETLRKEGEQKGINYVSFDRVGNMHIYGHSNALSYDPRVLINKDTIGQYLQLVSAHSGVRFDTGKVIRSAKCHQVHFTKDVNVGSPENVDKYVRLLRLLGSPKNYALRQYNNRAKKGGYSGMGATFKSTLATPKLNETMIFYNKGARLSSDQPGVYGDLLTQGKWDKVECLLRGELQLRKHHMIRTRTGAKDVRLISVLNGKLNPVDEVFAVLVKNSKLAEPPKFRNFNGLGLVDMSKINTKGMTDKEEEFAIFAYSLINTYGPCEEAIKAHYIRRGTNPKTMYKKLAKLRPFIAEIRAMEITPEKQTQWTINDIRELQKLFKAA